MPCLRPEASAYACHLRVEGRPRWSRGGRSLFFLRGTQIMRSTIDDGGGFAVAHAIVDVPGLRDFDVAHTRDAIVRARTHAGHVHATRIGPRRLDVGAHAAMIRFVILRLLILASFLIVEWRFIE